MEKLIFTFLNVWARIRNDGAEALPEAVMGARLIEKGKLTVESALCLKAKGIM